MRFLVLLVTVLLGLTKSEGNTVTIDIDDQTPYEGTSITVTCSTTANFTKWEIYRNQIDVLSSKDGSITPYSHEVLSTNDGGEFICSVFEDSAGKVAQHNSTAKNVTVKELFATPTITTAVTSYSSGSSVNITCVTKANKMNEEISYTFSHKENVITNSQSKNPTYTIQQISTKDIGSYSCKAEIGKVVKESSHSVDIQVTLPVSVTAKHTTIGSDTTITCNVPEHETGLSFTWSKENKILGNEVSKTLSLQSVTKAMNESVYECTASTNGITGKGSGKLFAYSPPSIQVKVSKAVSAGTSTTVQCHVISNDGNSKILFKWYENEKLLNGEDKKDLILNNVKKIMDGIVYKCHVTNEFGGTGEGSIALLVYDSSDINITVSNTDPFEGQTVNMTCQSRATLNITKWQLFRNSDSAPVKESIQSNVFSSISIRPGTNDTYYCVAINDDIDPDIKLTSKSVIVKAKEMFTAPTVTTGNTIYPSGSNVNITCKTKVNKVDETLSYTFLHNGNIIPNSQSKNSIYTIQQISTNDTGSYSCKAEVGTVIKNASNSVELQVTLPVSVTAKPTTIGSNTMIRCDAPPHETGLIFTWSKDGTKLENEVLKELSLTAVTKVMNGSVYECNALSPIGILGKGLGTLFVYAPPSVKVNTSTAIRAGTKAIVQCHVTSNDGNSKIQFKWYENEKPLNDANKTDLVLNNVERNMDGLVYKCHVTNEFDGTAEASVALLVYDSSDVNITVSNNQPIEGQKVEFTCNSRTALNFTKWQLIRDNDPNTTQEKTGSNVFSFVSILPGRTEGAYHCVAINDVINPPIKLTSQNVTVTARRIHSTPTLILTPNTTQLSSGSRLDLKCSFDVFIPNITSFKYEFAKDEDEIEGIPTNQSVFTLDPILVKDAGKYHCQVTTDYNKRDSEAVSVSVYLLVNVRSLLVPVYKNAVFDCNVFEGETDATYSWYSKNKQIVNETSKQLTLTNVTLSQSGSQYTCMVTSQGVTGNGTGVLTVLEPVTVSSGAFYMKNDVAWFLESQVAALLCPYNDSTIYWYKDGDLSQSNAKNSYQKIIQQQDEGSYTCNSTVNTTLAASVEIQVFTLNVTLKVSDDRKLIGSTVTLTCESQVSADTSISSYSFYEDGNLLGSQQQSNERIVTIQSLESTFHCGAESNWTISVNSSAVSVKAQAHNVTLKVSDDRKLIGSTVTLTCESQVSADTSISSYSFYEDGNLLGSQQPSHKRIVTIQSLESTFHCGAESNWTISVNSSAVSVKAQAFAAVNITTSSLHPVYGDNVNLTCTVVENPSSQIEHIIFYFNDSVVLNSTSYTLSLDGFNDNHTGNYYCKVVSNWTDTISSTKISLKLREAASVSIKKATLIVDENKLAWVHNNTVAELSCDSTSPSPVYSWYRNGVSLNVATKLITQTFFKGFDEGEYSCNDGSPSKNTVTIKIFTLSGANLVISPLPTFEGDTSTLTCTGIGDGAISSWRFFRQDANGAVVELQKGQNDNLVLTDVRENGSYFCEAIHNSSVAANSSIANLTVNSLFDVPKLMLSQASFNQTGGSVTIECLTTIKKNDQTALYKIYRGSTVVFQVQKFTVNPVQTVHAGQYMCTVTVGTISKNSTQKDLVVENLGLQLPATVVVNETSILELECKVAGNENGVIFTWTENGSSIANQAISVLRIENITREKQNAVYRCQGISSHGISGTSGNSKLTVQYLDKPVVQTASTIINEESSLSLQCSSQAYPEVSQYEWLKDGDVISGETSVTLEIAKVMRNYSGDYTCRVQNLLGVKESDAKSILVLYLDAPTIEVNPKIPIVEGENLSIICTANTTGLNGNSVTYRWTKKGIPDPLSNETILNFTNIRKERAGDYICEVSSNGMKNQQSINVIVYFLPSRVDITKSSVTDEILVGSQVTVSCTVTSLGLPEGNLTLFKGNERLDTTQNKRITYNINPLNTEDTGEYHCRAINPLGREVASSKTKITVIEKPFPVTKGIIYEVFPRYFKITWQKPFDGNKKITSYNVTYQDTTTGGSPIVQSTTTESVNISTSIHPDRNYSVFIVAINEIGPSDNSQTIVVLTKESVPSEPRFLAIAHNDTEKTLIASWQEPRPTNGDILTYRVCYKQLMNDGTRVNNAEEICKLQSGNLRTKTLDKLDAFSVYQIKVTAENGAGLGPSAMENGTTLEEVPQNVINIKSSTTNNSLTVAWEKPEHVYGVLQGYTVEYKEEDSSKLAYERVPHCRNIMTTSCTVDGLKAFTKYGVKIFILNRLHTNFIVKPDIQTKTGPPPPYTTVLPSPNANDVSTKSFPVKLIQFNTTNGPIVKYIIVAKKLSSGANPSRQPSSYSQKDIEDGIDGLFVVHIETDPNNFGETITISSKSTANRKRRAITVGDFTLDPDTYYTVFVRGVTVDGQYQTTTWYTPIKLESDGLAGGAIAGIVIAIILLIAILIVLWYFLYYKRRRGEKRSQIISMTSIQKRKSIRVPTIDPHIPVQANRFEDHVAQLAANSNIGFSQEYSMINRELEYKYNSSRLQENNIKNRYHNVPSYDETRVMLKVIDGEQHTDYINANFIDGYERNREYIATQGPLPETVFDFWRMVWENESTTIVMLTRLVEKGRVKCAQYWPDNGSSSLKDILITMTDIQEFPDHVVRTFHVTRTGQAIERIVKQFHYTAWPDFGVPVDPAALLGFLRKVNNWREMSPSGPAIIHCSAGVGRTGTYITIDSQIRSLKAKGELQIYKNVCLLRQQRCLMVQTEDQYVFIHRALMDYLESGETEVDANELRDYVRKHSQMESQTGMTGLMDEFIRLAKTDKNDRFVEANKSVNHPKNRFKNVYPYDDTRVRLLRHPGVEGSDYINANYIDSYGCKDYFIATQAPLEVTVGDFWRMIWEQNCGTIVMLSKEFEGQQSKVYPYWPQKGSLKFEQFFVETMQETTYGDYIVREMKLTHAEAAISRTVKQFQYTTWPESGSPESGVGIIELLGQVQKWNLSVNNTIITVHCSAGVGRTGVFIALSNLIERVKTEGVVDVYQTVKRMRQQRTAMVQTRDQYEFCYRALQEYLESFDVYANLH